jgi:1,4-alpha-glucan branching enzyme
MVTKELCYPNKVRVTFTMPAGIWADTIHLVGDFNNWSTTATPLQLSEHGWSVSLELEAGRAYQYRYLINGADWYNDWRADRYVPNEYGGDNSVVVTTLPNQEQRPVRPTTFYRKGTIGASQRPLTGSPVIFAEPA